MLLKINNSRSQFANNCGNTIHKMINLYMNGNSNKICRMLLKRYR